MDSISESSVLAKRTAYLRMDSNREPQGRRDTERATFGFVGPRSLCGSKPVLSSCGESRVRIHDHRWGGMSAAP